MPSRTHEVIEVIAIALGAFVVMVGFAALVGFAYQGGML